MLGVISFTCATQDSDLMQWWRATSVVGHSRNLTTSVVGHSRDLTTNGGQHHRLIAVRWQGDVLTLDLHLWLSDDVWIPDKHLGVWHILEELGEPINRHSWHQSHLKVDLCHRRF